MTSIAHNFRYTAIDPRGKQVTELLVAVDRATALRSIATKGVVLLDLREVRPPSAPGKIRIGKRAAAQERILMMRQLSVMIRARTDLIEAIDAIRADFPGDETRNGLTQVAIRLRRGESLGRAFAEAMPGFPPYTYALIEAGEATGRVDKVLEEAATQLEFDRDTLAEMRSALAYPAFLLAAGVGAMAFLFAIVVPRFAAMIGPRRDDIAGLAALVLDMGEAVRDYPLALFALGATAIGAVIWWATAPRTAAMRGRLADRLPLIRDIVAARQRAGWARIVAFASAQGVGLLESAQLAIAAVPPGRFRDALAGIVPALRAGRTLADTLGDDEAFPAMDRCLIRAGERAGAVAEMLHLVAANHEQKLRAMLKRTTRIVEQAAVLAVSVAIGAIVLGLVSAMTSVYESVQ